MTELVTNSVEHGDGDELEMTVTLGGGNVRVEVGDRGPGFRSSRFARSGGERGWGLYIVDLLADRWGVDRRDRTWVWFEIDATRAGAPR